ncbi:HlyD family efflux transporter periplasmic adaptor subunit [Falsiroseomonas sp. HW251]|uniref:HlyD family efflux transporter periplasmic adaptor subunit n=1 Tax=Falsiroseomonas sp. HW251 TaxID=3390998 RepID=UPI003D323C7B
MSRIAPAPPPPSKRKLPVGRARLVVAAVLVGTAALGLARQQFTVATEHAVVSATTIPLRTPIGGEVARIALRAGEELPEGAAVLVENPRADRRRLLDVLAERDRAADEAASLGAQIASLDDLSASLAQRAAAYREETARMLSAGVEEGLRQLAAAEARARRAGQEATRTIELARGGYAAASLRERVEADRDAALQEAGAFAARGAALRAQEEALSRGFVLNGGFGGVGYLDQRLDEIAMRRTDLARQLAAQQAALARASRRVAEETARHETERAATLQAPPGLRAWRVLAAPGQRVQAEETVAELLDCRAVFMLAVVAQRDVPMIQPGQPARVLLDGDPTERAGVVHGFLPDGMVTEGGRIAAVPTRPRGGGQVVQVDIATPPQGPACPVGRTGRVIFERPVALPGL